MAALETGIFTQLTEELQDLWRQLWNSSEFRHFFNSPSWFVACQEAFGYRQVRVIVIYEAGLPVALLPLVLGRKFLVPSYQNPGSDMADKCGLVVRKGYMHVVPDIFLAAGKLGNIFISELSQKYISELNSSRLQLGINQSSLTPILELNDDPFRFLKGKRRNRINAVINRYGDNLSFEVCRDSLETCLIDAVNIEMDSFKRLKGKSDIDKPHVAALYKSLVRLCPDNVMLVFLKLDGKRIAYKLCFVADDYVHNYNTAYVKSFREIYPGKVILFKLVEYLGSHGFRVMDLGRGVNNLKLEFTEVILPQYDIYSSPNLFYQGVWKTAVSLKGWLEKHPVLFSVAAKIKKSLSL